MSLVLNPDGALAMGIEVGRCSLDVLTMEPAGQIRLGPVGTGEYLVSEALFARIEQRLDALSDNLDDRADGPFGLGLTAPLWRNAAGFFRCVRKGHGDVERHR